MRKKSVPKRAPISSTIPSSPPANLKRRNIEGIDDIFDAYANNASGLIEPEGIEALCSDIGLEQNDVRTLMLSWKMEAKHQGYFSRDEWRRGLLALRADTLDELQEAVSQLDVETMEEFENFYQYAFHFNLTEDNPRAVDVVNAYKLLDLVLKPILPTPADFFIDLFIEYLKSQSEYKNINLDQWKSFPQFFREVHFPSLKNYSPDDAWPVILDKFVKWRLEMKK